MSIMFLAQRTRPDALLTASYLSSRVSTCNTKDEEDLEHCARYLNSTKQLGIIVKASSLQLEATIDASYAIHPNAKGHTGVIISFENCGGVTFVKSSKQKLVARSSTESELIALHDGVAQIAWVRQLMSQLGFQQRPTQVAQDNKSTMHMANKGEGNHSRSKHINVRYFWVKQAIDDREIEIYHCPTSEMLADFMTKPTFGKSFIERRNLILGESLN